jgi:predicted cobalt transporter CbtA
VQATTFDIVSYAVLALSFAVWVTVHVALSWGLLTRRPAWHGLLGFFVIPLAPLFGFKQELRTRAILWLAALGVYTVAYLVASQS